MNYLKSSLSEDEAVAARTGAGLGAATGASDRAGVETRDTAGAGVEVLMPLIGTGPGAALANLSLPIEGGF